MTLHYSIEWWRVSMSQTTAHLYDPNGLIKRTVCGLPFQRDARQDRHHSYDLCMECDLLTLDT